MESRRTTKRTGQRPNEQRDITLEPFDYGQLQPGDIAIERDGTRWLVHGLARFAGGGGRSQKRQRGISVRPEGGGRARVLSVSYFKKMERRDEG